MDAQHGAVHGTVVRGDGISAVGTQVVVRGADGAVRAVLTADAAGEFKAAGLAPGLYEMRAADGGAERGAPVTVEVAAGGDAVARLELQTAAEAAPVAPVAPLDKSFMHKLGRAYVADWAGNDPATAIPQGKRRGTPPPLFSPPYPATDWPIGGTVVIGSPDGQTYPLMQAVNENRSINKIYGWIEVGANGSTNN